MSLKKGNCSCTAPSDWLTWNALPAPNEPSTVKMANMPARTLPVRGRLNSAKPFDRYSIGPPMMRPSGRTSR